MTGFVPQAQAYLRTAEAALAGGDYGPAYENARTAAELAAKHLLSQKGLPPKGPQRGRGAHEGRPLAGGRAVQAALQVPWRPHARNLWVP